MINKFKKNVSQLHIDEAIRELSANQNNAVVSVNYNATVQKRGLLAGVPVTVKDIFATKTGCTQASCKLLKNFQPGYDSKVVEIIEQNGATIVGKTNLDELGLGGTGLFSANGIIKNPLNCKHLIGGSSSGAAASFTDKIGLAICSDTGDSARIPASYRGIVGFKPSYGAVSRYGMFPYASSLDTVGWMTHNVIDAAFVASILFEKDPRDFTSKNVSFNYKQIKMTKPKKIIYFYPQSGLQSYIKDAMDNLFKKLRSENIIVEKMKIDEQLIKAIHAVYYIISFAEMASNDSNLTGLFFGQQVTGNSWQSTMQKSRGSGFGQIPTMRMILGSLFLEKDNQILFLQKAQKVRRLIVEQFNQAFANCDLLILPGAMSIPPTIASTQKNIINFDPDGNYGEAILGSANLGGFPSLTIPFSTHKELPFGINLNNELYGDQKLFQYSLYIEKIIKEMREPKI